MKRLDYYWYTRSPWLLLLTPFSLVFRMLVALRRQLYRMGVIPAHEMAVPVVVIGNLSVGGTGKTPLIAWLAEFLKQAGYSPGIIARGYRGRAGQWPQRVQHDSDPEMVGDEAVLLADLTRCPVAVAPNRVSAAQALLEGGDCDLILSDDGLQHYALRRDVEIAVIDGVRRFGNGYCLPAGPLREPASRLRQVDLVVINGLAGKGEFPMRITSSRLVSLKDGVESRELSSFRRQSVHAVAGIGNPDRFFATLNQAGMLVKEHPFPDHHGYTAEDLAFPDSCPIIMTQKDAVKCRRYGLENVRYAPVTIEMPTAFGARVLELLQSVDRAHLVVV